MSNSPNNPTSRRLNAAALECVSTHDLQRTLAGLESSIILTCERVGTCKTLGEHTADDEAILRRQIRAIGIVRRVLEARELEWNERAERDARARGIDIDCPFSQIHGV